MQPEDVKAMIEAGLPGAEVKVESDGSHFDAIVVSAEFEGKTRIKREQMLNAILFDKITSGEIHAFNPKAYTPEEWKTASQMQIS
jgi:acid stress-induced BolA-like protein IbaG/YrbA